MIAGNEEMKNLYKKLSAELQAEINDALHEILCQTILKLLRESMDNPGLLKEEIQSAREFTEMKPDSDEARKLLEFLDSDRIKKWF